MAINFSLSQFSSAAYSILKCEFEENYVIYGESPGYTCAVEDVSITSKDDRELKFAGIHLDERNNNDVKKFHCEGHEMRFLPQYLGDVFPNLEMLALFHNNLEEIKSEDLKTLKNLEVLWIERNNLKVLDSDLFINNPKLRFIAISSNKIVHVDFYTFDHLLNLEKLYFEFNPCQSSLANTKEQVQDLIIKIDNNCKQMSVSTAVKNVATSTSEKYESEENSEDQHGPHLASDARTNLLTVNFLLILTSLRFLL